MVYFDFSPLVLDKHNIGNGYETYFNNTDEINCPVDKCEILQKGCKAPFAAASKQAKYFSL